MSSEADQFGRRPERKILRDRILRSQLGRNVLMAVTVGMVGGALDAGVDYFTGGDSHPNTPTVNKALPPDGSAIEPTLPAQVRMGNQRVTLHGVYEKPTGK